MTEARRQKILLIFFVIFLLFSTSWLFYYHSSWYEDRRLEHELELINWRCDAGVPEALGKALKAYVHEVHTTKIAFSFQRKGEDVAYCTGGYMGRPLFSKRVDQDTPFLWASVSKIFTADRIMALVRHGEISLEEPFLHALGTEADEVDDPRVRDIAISDLLLHVAGFDRDIRGDRIFIDQYSCATDPHFLQHYTLEHAPREDLYYSNLGYCLLGLLLDQRNGQQTLLQQYQHDFAAPELRLMDQNWIKERFSIDTLHWRNPLEQSAAFIGLVGSSATLHRMLNSLEHKAQPNAFSSVNPYPCIPWHVEKSEDEEPEKIKASINMEDESAVTCRETYGFFTHHGAWYHSGAAPDTTALAIISEGGSASLLYDANHIIYDQLNTLHLLDLITPYLNEK